VYSWTAISAFNQVDELQVSDVCTRAWPKRVGSVYHHDTVCNNNTNKMERITYYLFTYLPK
jgi:hypothetical protein